MCCSTPGSSALHYLLEPAQILVHWVVIYILKCISNKIFIRVVCWKWKSAHEKNQHTWIDILCSWIRTLNTVRTSILLTLIYRFNILPLKLQKDFFFFLHKCTAKEPLLLLQFTSVVSDSVRPHRRQPTRLPRPWDSPGKNTGVSCHFLLQWSRSVVSDS